MNMKRICTAILAALLLAALFTSCGEPAVDRHVTARFVTSGGRSRSLTETSPSIAIDDAGLEWHYSATKASEHEFNYGATDDTTVTFNAGGESGEITFSQGIWNFELWAFKAGDEATPKVFYGKTDGVLIAGEDASISVTVSPYVDGMTGTIEFKDVKIRLHGGGKEVSPNYATVDGVAVSDFIDGSATVGELAAGPHDIVVEYRGEDGVTYASETKTVTVYSGRTTAVTGFVGEDVSAGVIVVSGSVAYVTQEVTAEEPIEFKPPVAPIPGKATTTVTVPAGIIEVSSEPGVTTSAKLDVEVKASPAAEDVEEQYVVVAAGESLVAALDLTLTKVTQAEGAAAQTETISSFGNPVTIETYVEKGLAEVKVRYNGDGDHPDAGGGGADGVATIYATDDAMDASLGYSQETGRLRFTVSHFSGYYVVARPYVAKVGDALYTSLAKALANAVSGSTVTLLKDATDSVASGAYPIPKGSEVTLDLNGKTITFNNATMTTPVVNVYGKLTVKNDSNEKGKGGIIQDGSTMTGIVDVYDGGTLIVDKGYYESKGLSGGAIINGRADSNITLNSVHAYCSAQDATVRVAGTTKVNGGTFISDSSNGEGKTKYRYAFDVYGGGTTIANATIEGVFGGLAINGGTVTIDNVAAKTRWEEGYGNTYYALYIAGEEDEIECTINSGTFTSAQRVAAYIGNSGVQDGGKRLPFKVTVNGGTFYGGTMLDGTVSAAVSVTLVNTGEDTVLFTGGSFSSKPDARYIKKDYEAVERNGLWKIQKMEPVASVLSPSGASLGEFFSLQDAFTKVPSGGTVKLLKDAEITTAELKTDRSFTLDLNQKTLTTSKALRYGVSPFSSQVSPVVETIKNGTFKGDSNGYIRFEDGCTGIFENVRFIIADSKAHQIVETNADNKDGAETINTYIFNRCTFDNAYVKFAGKSESCNKFELTFDSCNFSIDDVASSSYASIMVDSYAYGKMTIKDSNFDITSSYTYGFNIGTNLGYTKGKTFEVNLTKTKISTSGTAKPYAFEISDSDGIGYPNAYITADADTEFHIDSVKTDADNFYGTCFTQAGYVCIKKNDSSGAVLGFKSLQAAFDYEWD